jgi:hypothetical protein
MKTATYGLNMLSCPLSGIGKAIQGLDPSTVSTLTMTVATFRGVTLVTALGALAVAVIGPVSLAVAGITGLAAALRTFVYMKWDAITRLVSGLAAKLSGGLMSIPGMVIGAISAMASSIANAIKGALGFGASGAPKGGGGVSVPLVPDGIGGMTPQRWTPPPRSGNGMHQTRVQINLDGYRLGEAVAYHVVRANQHVAAAAQFDGGAMHIRSTCRPRETVSRGVGRLSTWPALPSPGARAFFAFGG